MIPSSGRRRRQALLRPGRPRLAAGLVLVPALFLGACGPGGGDDCPTGPGDCAWFEEVAVARGLVVDAPPAGTGAGVALGDVDGDGRLDVVRSARLDHVRLFLQAAGGAFEDASAAWGLDAVPAEMAVVLADHDGDGDLDLAASSVAPERDLFLLRNDGPAAGFADVTGAAGLVSLGWATGLAWADYDRDGDLDLYVARYHASADNTLWRNEDGVAFTDVTAAAGVADPGGLSFQPIWLDADDDGLADLYVADDKATLPVLFRNRGDGTFEDVSAAAGVDLAIEGMGVAAEDLNADGVLDLYVGNVPGEPFAELGNLLCLGSPEGRFVEAARARGAAVDRWTWGVAALDPDLDGDLDLFAAVGSEAGGESNVLLEDVDGRGFYGDATARFGTPYTGDSYGAAAGDVDGDGRPDLVVANRFTDPAILYYRNRLEGGGHFLKIRLAGAGRNRFGIGARVTVETPDAARSRELRAGEGLLGAGPPELLFGLGASVAATRVTVRWPSGATTDVAGPVAADTVLEILEME